jgi:hypothetical protein
LPWAGLLNLFLFIILVDFLFLSVSKHMQLLCELSFTHSTLSHYLNSLHYACVFLAVRRVLLCHSLTGSHHVFSFIAAVCPSPHLVHAKTSLRDKLQDFADCFRDNNRDASPACNSLQKSSSNSNRTLQSLVSRVL